jgi:hypothetical protein
MASPISTVNKLLAKAGRTEWLVRSRLGYYYVADVWCSSSLMAYRLDDTPSDHELAVLHVEEVLTEVDGKPFKLVK